MEDFNTTLKLSLMEYIKQYEFKDKENVYTNGAMLIPSFRIKEWIDYNLKGE